MYHCQVRFYFVGCEHTMCRAVKEIAPLEDFSHTFEESEELNEDMLAKADVVFVRLKENKDMPQYLLSARKKKVQGILLADKKKKAQWILLADKEQVSSLSREEMAGFSDIWIMPLSEEEVAFRFLRWQQMYKRDWDLWQARNYLDTTINSVPHLIWYKDKEGAHEKVNQSFCKAVNKTMEQIEGRGHYYIWDIDPDEYARGEFICMESEYEVMEKRETCVFDENVKIGNEMRQLQTYKSPLFDIDGEVMGTVGIAMDVTQERMYEQMIINNANTDFLTGLYNRRYVYQFLEDKGEEPFVLYYIDLDHFKEVNDKYGHQEGDRALVLTKDILEECMPECMIARLGGDEFLVVQMGSFTEEQIEQKRVWLAEQMDCVFAAQEHFRHISASIGTSSSKGGDVEMDAKIGEADAHMYDEKNRKKGVNIEEKAE